MANFYKIDFEREVVVQGRNSAFLTITRNDDGLTGSIPSNKVLVVLAYPQTNTFELHGSITGLTYNSLASSSGTAAFNMTVSGNPSPFDDNQPAFNRLSNDLIIKNWYQLFPSLTGGQGPIKIASYENRTIAVTPANNSYTGPLPVPASPVPTLEVGRYVNDSDVWRINGANPQVQVNTLEVQKDNIYWVPFEDEPNPFDGTVYNDYGDSTGFYSRPYILWNVVRYDEANTSTNGITFRIDYDGSKDSHLKLNFLIVALEKDDSNPLDLIAYNKDPENWPDGPYGFKSSTLATNAADVYYYDYQEVHLFGYKEDYVRPSRNIEGLEFPIANPIYEDNSSYSLLKTNPKISGNVKLTVDSVGDIWLNSFDANKELADSKYKRYPVSSNSTYQNDLYSFFNKGQTPADIVFDLFQADDQYLNTKRSYSEQYDNFYNYGVEQLNSKFYDEDYNFLAPLWLRKDVPDYFIIFRLNHPISYDSYLGVSNQERFNNFFKDASIVKTFDLRATSKIGAYLRNIVEDERYQERPLEVSWDADVATYWHGISYKDATITAKGEFLHDYYKKDRPIKEFEEYITGGFERNSIVSLNLINMEFLFNDPEAPLYGINRYFGLYLKENQLAEFELEPRAFDVIDGQTPPPKPGVDGGPASSRDFIQTNPNGIQLPIHYYHSDRLTNNTSNIPLYQGNVIGKFPLPSMVDDPLRFFYVKDRNDEFKRVVKMTEVETGVMGEEGTIRSTNLHLFDTQENIRNYSGITNITSQVNANQLGPGHAQLVLSLFDQKNSGVFADDEELSISVLKYNNPGVKTTFYLQVSNVSGDIVTVEYFINQTCVVSTQATTLNQPAVGSTLTVSVDANDLEKFTAGKRVYIPTGGYYIIEQVSDSPAQIVVRNLGSPENAAVGVPAVYPGTYIAEFPISVLTVDQSSPTLDPIVNLDNEIEVNLSNAYATGDSWRIEANYPIINTYITNGSGSISSSFIRTYTKFTWRMIANSTGLKPGDAWDYPVADPDSNDYVSNFSNEGTPKQVARAIATCIRNFDNIPVEAVAIDEKIYLTSKLRGNEGNDIRFTRKMRDDSFYVNLGFYEVDVVNRNTAITQPIYEGTSLSAPDFKPVILEQSDLPGSTSYWLNITKRGSTYFVWGRLGCESDSYDTIRSTGQSIWTSTSSTSFTYEGLPLRLDFSKISDGETIETIYTITSHSEISQNFIGGNLRPRNRIRISAQDGTNYYADKRQDKSANITKGSQTVSIDTGGIYIGAPITGSGIPENTVVTDINKGLIVINNPATTTATVNVNIGGITIANDKPILQQWFQTQKDNYSRIKGWNVQGKYVYSLPYLEEPLYDENNYLIGYDRNDLYSIVQIENPNEEIFVSSSLTAVAYEVFRPTFGIFSLYPIKEFDFDFVLSDYSYTPILEAETYFNKGVVKNYEYFELPIHENFVITQYNYKLNPVTEKLEKTLVDPGKQPYTLLLQAYNPETSSWYSVDTLSIRADSANIPPSSSSILINTFYPLYDYHSSEFPFMSVGPGEENSPPYDKNYQFRGVGFRNYDRRYLRTFDPITKKDVVFYPEKFRISYINGYANLNNNYLAIEIENYNYQKDRDIKTFAGFAGLQDIENVQDAAKIQSKRDAGEYVDAFTFQLLLSEYDRLRENFTKEYAVKSKVVPYINKWVQEGTDARDNYYRLNTSLAFGINNLSPNEDVDFFEPGVLTNEFPYLDSTPKDYPLVSFENSRSYMFARLNDLAYDGKTWLDLLTTDERADWFTKYFTVGYPSEENFNGQKIGKSREERYTFFRYNPGADRSQTLFRGGKIEVIDYNDIDPLNIAEVTESTLYVDYKFSAVARFIRNEFYVKEKPVEIEIIKNDTYKTILMIITVRLNDYRMQHGHSDYMMQYFMNDVLKNNNQQQLFIPYIVFGTSGASFRLRNFFPYTNNFNWNTTTHNFILRNRQGFLGGGYVQLGDKKLGGLMNFTRNAAPLPTLTPVESEEALDSSAIFTRLLTVFLKPVSSTYDFNMQKEQTTIQNNYRVDLKNYPFLTNIGITGSVVSKELGQDGYFFNLHTTSVNDIGFIRMRSSIDAQSLGNSIKPNSVSFGVADRFPSFAAYPSTTFFEGFQGSGLEASFRAQKQVGGFDQEQETISVEGGTQSFVSIKNYLTFANIKNLLNADSEQISYYKVENNQKLQATDYRLRIVTGDPVIKNSVIHFATDEDKPQEYLDRRVIGYNFTPTRTQEYIIRHRGYYEPKTRDVISFWVREENSVSNHFEKDFLLGNTRINSASTTAGLLRNYNINKVATSGEVLKIARGSSYESLYPLVGEVSVANVDRFALNGSWDDKFYRNYLSTTSYVDVEGIVEMQETKSFLSSKVMSVPETHEMYTFKDQTSARQYEVKYELIPASVSIGLKTLDKVGSTKKSKDNSDKATLKIIVNVKNRLLRQLLEDINSGNYVDEFSLLQKSNVKKLKSLTDADVRKLKSQYLEKNIIKLYELIELNLYVSNRKGIKLLDLDLTEQGRVAGGYDIDKNCSVEKTGEYEYTITKVLDPKVPSGFGLSIFMKRI